MEAMSLRQAILGAIWAAIFTVVLQFAPAPAYAHGVHIPHPGEVATASHKAAGVPAMHHKAASQPANPVPQPASLSITPGPEWDIAIVFTSACCGMGHGCAAATIGLAAELPDFGAAIRLSAFAAEHRSGIDPDGLARPPRPVAS